MCFGSSLLSISPFSVFTMPIGRVGKRPGIFAVPGGRRRRVTSSRPHFRRDAYRPAGFRAARARGTMARRVKRVFAPRKKTRRRGVIKTHPGKKSFAKGLDYFDASLPHQLLLPIPNSLGVATHVTSSHTANITNGANDFLIVQSGASGVAFYQIHGGTRVVSHQTFGQIIGTAPETIRPSRISLQLFNTTSEPNRQGVVYSLTTVSPLAWEFDGVAFTVSAPFLASIDAMVKEHRYSKVMTNDSLRHGFKSVLLPASAVGIATWRPYTVFAAPPTEQQIAVIADANNNGFHTWICHIPTEASAQSYTLKVDMQFATRYPANHLLANVAGPLQSTDSHPFNRAVEDARMEEASGRPSGSGH